MLSFSFSGVKEAISGGNCANWLSWKI